MSPVPWEEPVGEEVLEVLPHTDWGSEGQLAWREPMLELQRRKRDPMREELPVVGPRTKRVPEGEPRTWRVVQTMVGEPRRKHRDPPQQVQQEPFPPWAYHPTFHSKEQEVLP